MRRAPSPRLPSSRRWKAGIDKGDAGAIGQRGFAIGKPSQWRCPDNPGRSQRLLRLPGSLKKQPQVSSLTICREKEAIAASFSFLYASLPVFLPAVFPNVRPKSSLNNSGFVVYYAECFCTPHRAALKVKPPLLHWNAHPANLKPNFRPLNWKGMNQLGTYSPQ